MTAEWVRVDLDVVEKYGADAAVVLGLIAYRCNLTGEWEATLDTMAAETRLKHRRVRTLVGVLRDAGLIFSHRADRNQAVLTWTVSPGQAEKTVSVITGRQQASSLEVTAGVITSTTEEQELPLVVPSPPAPAKKASRATRLPADFRPTDAHWTLARSLGVDLTHEGPQFSDHHTAKGSTFKDWDAALRTWIRNAAKFAAARGDGPLSDVPPPVPTDALRRSGW